MTTRAPLVVVDEARCTACGACGRVCPPRLFDLSRSGPPRLDAEADRLCLRCGHCVATCPADALRHADLDPADFPPAPEPPDFQSALGWLRARRSVRAYAGRPVAEEDVASLLQAARYAPTGHNARHVGCVAVLDAEGVAALRGALVSFYRRALAVAGNPLGRLLLALVFGPGRSRELAEALPGARRVAARLAAGEDPLFHGAPALLLFHAPAGRETAETDCALASGQVTLLAPSLGLGTCHIGYASAALKRFGRLGRRFGVPPGRRVFAVLTLGHPALPCRRLVPRPPLEAQRSRP